MNTNHFDTEDLRYEVHDRVAIVTITRPAHGNSITQRMFEPLRQMWNEIRRDPEVRVAIITSAGDRFFSTGADVSDLQSAAMQSAPLDQILTLTSQQNKVWKPVICAVNGMVVGGGLHFVVDSDIVVAAATATFLDTHVSVGQVGAIENIGLAKRLPLGTALRMTLQGRSFRLTAERGYQLGFVDEVVPTAADVLPKALEIAQDIAQNSPAAMALSKEAIWKSMETGYAASLEYGWALLRMHWSHPDFVEGPLAFVEKREPRWNPDGNARR